MVRGVAFRHFERRAQLLWTKLAICSSFTRCFDARSSARSISSPMLRSAASMVWSELCATALREIFDRVVGIANYRSTYLLDVTLPGFFIFLLRQFAENLAEIFLVQPRHRFATDNLTVCAIDDAVVALHDEQR